MRAPAHRDRTRRRTVISRFCILITDFAIVISRNYQAARRASGVFGPDLPTGRDGPNVLWMGYP
jgi:hypothetical protein